MRRHSSLAPLLAAALLAACVRTPAAPPVPAPIPAAESPAAEAPALDDDLAWLRERSLMVPVEGVTPDRIPNTFNAPRSGSRVHAATDILAPRGTPVLAAVDGRVLRVSRNNLGGLVVYATDDDERFVYYYAHLDRYADGLVEGMKLARGTVIGYVGTTGNAPESTPHLHFQVMRRDSGRRYWDGTPVDVLPFLVEPGQKR